MNRTDVGISCWFYFVSPFAVYENNTLSPYLFDLFAFRLPLRHLMETKLLFELLEPEQ